MTKKIKCQLIKHDQADVKSIRVIKSHLFDARRLHSFIKERARAITLND